MVEKQKIHFPQIFFQYTLVGNVGKNTAMNAEVEGEPIVLSVARLTIRIMIRSIRVKLMGLCVAFVLSISVNFSVICLLFCFLSEILPEDNRIQREVNH